MPGVNPTFRRYGKSNPTVSTATQDLQLSGRECGLTLPQTRNRLFSVPIPNLSLPQNFAWKIARESLDKRGKRQSNRVFPFRRVVLARTFVHQSGNDSSSNSSLQL